MNFILFIHSGGFGGLGGCGGLGGFGGLGSFGGLGGLGGLGGFGGIGGGPICGIPIGFGVTTTVGGFDPYENEFIGGGGGYGPYLGATGIPPRGVAGVGGAANRLLHRGPYARGYL